MNKIIITCLLVMLQMALYAQVGIGTNTPNASAAVEIAATDKGLLIPQMTAAQRTAITSPATGLLVIQTDADKGFYYNAGTPATPNWILLSAYTLQQNINTNNKFISGDGTNSGLQLYEGGLLLGTGTYTGVNNGRTFTAGPKLIWAPHKAAFRLGYTTAGQWNDENIGRWSIAMGMNSNASGVAAMAFGFDAKASGNHSVAMGATVSTNNQPGSFIFGDATLNGPYSNTASNQMLMRFTNGYQLYASNSNAPAMAIDNVGRMAIGKTTPTEELDVAGNIIYSGTLNMGIQYITYDYTLAGNNRALLPCTCPAGTQVIGGGGGHRDWNSAANDIKVSYTGPDPSDPTRVWRIIINNTSGSARAIRVYAICAKVK
jgi:hypothetical protein